MVILRPAHLDKRSQGRKERGREDGGIQRDVKEKERGRGDSDTPVQKSVDTYMHTIINTYPLVHIQIHVSVCE